MRAVVVACLLVSPLIGCKKSEQQQQGSSKMVAGESAGSNKHQVQQVAPPLDVKKPPADAVKTPSGLVYRTIKPNPSGQLPKRNDTVMIRYTGWRQDTGETFFSSTESDAPMPINLSTSAKGFTEGLQLVHKGEKAML